MLLLRGPHPSEAIWRNRYHLRKWAAQIKNFQVLWDCRIQSNHFLGAWCMCVLEACFWNIIFSQLSRLKVWDRKPDGYEALTKGRLVTIWVVSVTGYWCLTGRLEVGWARQMWALQSCTNCTALEAMGRQGRCYSLTSVMCWAIADDLRTTGKSVQRAKMTQLSCKWAPGSSVED